MPGKIQPTLTTALIGEYTARTTLKVNPDTFCETTVTLSGTPCKDIPEAAPEDCDATYSVPAPDALASGITLSAGDEFTAGDFLVTVTQITSGDKAGWNGEGYVTIKVGGLVELKRLAVTFDAAVVNSCYELSAGGVKTTYDPTWSNILDVDAVIQETKEVIDELYDLFETFSGSIQEKVKICDALSILESEFESNTSLTEFQKANAGPIIEDVINSWNQTCYACASSNLRTTQAESSTDCSIEVVKSNYNDFTKVYQLVESDCIYNGPALTYPSNAKEGYKKRVEGLLGPRAPGVGLGRCYKDYYLYKVTTSPLLETRKRNSGVPLVDNVVFLGEAAYKKQFQDLFEMMAVISGAFPDKIRNDFEAPDIVEQFFTINNESSFDDNFLHIASNEVQEIIQSSIFNRSGAVTPVYIEAEIVSLGELVNFRAIATAFKSNTFRLGQYITQAKVKSRISKEIIAEIEEGIIRKSLTQKGGRVVGKIYNENVEGTVRKVTLIVEKAGKKYLSHWDEFLEEILPKNSSDLKKYFGTTDLKNAKNLELSLDVQRQLATSVKSIPNNGEFGEAIEVVLRNELAEKTGLRAIPAQNASGNGIDILLVDDLDNPSIAMVIEVKGTRATSNPRFTYGTAYGGNIQQTDGWIRGVRNAVFPNPGPERELIDKILRNEIKSYKLGIFVDGNGIIKTLKF
jgi:hypothetical protein